MVEKELEDIYRYAKPNNKNMKDYEKKKNRHTINIEMFIIYIDGQCHKASRK